jgi:hypothetical protein
LALKRKLHLAILLGALASWSDVGLSLAHTGEVHIGSLSSAASLAIIVIAVLVVAIFVGLFLLRWRESVREATARRMEGDGDEAPEFETQEKG